MKAVNGPLARELLALPEPVQPAALLHHLLTVLRYERMDAHAAAWAVHDLTAAEVVSLTTVLDKGTVPPPTRLVERGWISADGAATTAGRAARDAIELGTNERCRHLINAVDLPSAWLASLRTLQTRPLRPDRSARCDDIDHRCQNERHGSRDRAGPA